MTTNHVATPEEEPLSGGNTSGSVFKAGDTLRKQWTDATPFVHQFLRHLRIHHVPVPEPLGHDEHGRQILEYIPGSLALESPPLTHEKLYQVGALIRRIHQVSATFDPPSNAVWETAITAPGADLVCHNDLAPWNLVIDGEKLTFIDWDAAAPSTVAWDLAYAASSFCLLDVTVDPYIAAENLVVFLSGYGADKALRKQLPEVMVQRVQAMYALLLSSFESGVEPWASMYMKGHGEHWRAVCEYVGGHQQVWEQALSGEDKFASHRRLFTHSEELFTDPIVHTGQN